jgi:3',5'-cyclic AMP phosphodiesterase CpdA
MLLTTDLHLTDRSKDEYRWDVFPLLSEIMLETGEKDLVILGDLTDAKDYHSAALVNRIVDTLLGFAEDEDRSVTILKGNHDYKDESCPFFRFLGHKMLRRPVRFITHQEFHRRLENTLFLPHTTDPISDWDKIVLQPRVQNIVCHQTYDGANAGDGYRLSAGVSSRYWSSRGFKGNVFAGDIHVPQTLGDVTYVGCPYPVSFGDNFTPRVLQVGNGKTTSIEIPSIRRWSVDIREVDDLYSLGVKDGDQMKIMMNIPRAQFPDWEEYRADLYDTAAKLGATVHSAGLRIQSENSRKKVQSDVGFNTTKTALPPEVLKQFCAERGIDETLEWFGKNLLE